MRKRILISVLSLAILFLTLGMRTRGRAQNTSPQPGGESFDILIVNGHIIDGSGAPSYAADIGIRADNIVAIGNLKGASATKVIDASGKIVSPGFIDMLGRHESRARAPRKKKLSHGASPRNNARCGNRSPWKLSGPSLPSDKNFPSTLLTLRKLDCYDELISGSSA